MQDRHLCCPRTFPWTRSGPHYLNFEIATAWMVCDNFWKLLILKHFLL